MKKNNTQNNDPIGIFDSGLGGITVAKALMKLMPHEDLVYFGDTARVPYGTKSRESIVRFSVENAEILMKHKVKIIVVACNSSSSCSLETLQAQFPVPVIGVISPGARQAAAATMNNRIGVIATSATVNSGAYDKFVHVFAPQAKVFSQACPLFVPLVEEGWSGKKIALDIANEYLKNLKKYKVDTLVLGCTHYPLLKNILRQAMGAKVKLVDSAEEVVWEVKRVLQEKALIKDGRAKGKYEFLVSDRPQSFEKIAQRFLGDKIKIKLVNTK
ncbi:MAG: glutamate racemase [Candidatus Omnitrophica bacterium]|nr:glutamate racemase [Candidatus Omnitrophota bacterium]